MQFCAECGSADLSTPSPPASWAHRLTGVLLALFASATMGLVIISAALSLLGRVDGSVLAGPLAELVVVVVFLYWTTTLLPGPIRKLGKAAGKQVVKSIIKNKRA